jgi:thioredoxin 2
MAPEYEKASLGLEPNVRFLKLNSDNEQQWSAGRGIRGIPTMILFKDGREADRVSGAMSAAQIGDWVRSRIS